MYMQNFTEDTFNETMRLVLEQGGMAVRLQEGQHISVPPGWWHAAYNHSPTVSVNNIELTWWEYPRTLYSTFKMQLAYLNQVVRNEVNGNLQFYRGSFTLSENLVGDLLEWTGRQAFPGGFHPHIQKHDKKNTQYSVARAKDECDLMEGGNDTDDHMLKKAEYMFFLNKAIITAKKMMDFRKNTTPAQKLLLKEENKSRCVLGWSEGFGDSLARWLLQQIYKPAPKYLSEY